MKYWTVEIKVIFFVGTSWEKKMKDRKLLSNQHYGTRYHQDSNYLDTYLIKMWLCNGLICTLFIYLRLLLIFLKTVNLKKKWTWWQIPPQHQSTYLGGPESASIEIPPFTPFLWCKFSKMEIFKNFRIAPKFFFLYNT